MREELAYIERIDQYLDNTMSAEERAAFEEELSTNKELIEDVEFYKNLREGISRQAIKLDIKKAQYRFIKKAKTRARWRRYLLGGGSLLIMMIAVFVIAIPENEMEGSFIYQLFGNHKVEKGGNAYTPESEFFSIDPGTDTTITTANGSKIHLPKGSLVLPGGRTPENPIEIEFAETVRPDDMVLAGLATGNSGEALEAKNIHFFNAKKDGKQLYPNNDLPPYIEIPTDEDVDPDVKLYTGKRDKAGDLNWQRPRLPENFLTPVAFKFLNYYPPGFKDSVKAKLPYKGHQIASRAFVDSLYFTRRQLASVVKIIGDPRDTTAIVERVTTIKNLNDPQPAYCGISPRSIQTMTQAKFERSLFATREFMERLDTIYSTCDQELLNIYLNNSSKQLWEIDEMAFDYLMKRTPDMATENHVKGKKLFQSHCSSCHAIGRPMTGPDIAGAFNRWNDKELLYAWIKNPGGVKLSGNAYAANMLSEWLGKSGLMNPQTVNNDEIDRILSYVESERYEDGKWADIFKNFAAQKLTNVPNSHIYSTLIERDFGKDLKTFNKEFEKAEKAYQKELRKQHKASEKVVAEYKKMVEKRVKTRMKSYGYKVKTMGWKNLAKEVETATVYTPPQLTITTNDFSKYDHVHAYFAVTELKVIGKLNRLSAGSFQMNEHRIINLPKQNAEYVQLITVGFIGDDIYLNEQPYPTKTSGSIEISLEKRTEAEAREILNKYSGKRKSQNILTDLNFQRQFYNDHIRRLKLQQDERFLTSLNNVAFPCCQQHIPRLDKNIHFPEFDITNWMEMRVEEGIEVVHPDGSREYILKSKDPKRFEFYMKKD